MDWPIADIESALKVDANTGRAGVYAFSLINEQLGVRLKLELCQVECSARLYVDRNRKQRPTFIGRLDVRDITAITVDADMGLVRLHTGHGITSTLAISAIATFTAGLGIED